MDVTIKKYFEDPRLCWSKFSWNVEWDRWLSLSTASILPLSLTAVRTLAAARLQKSCGSTLLASEQLWEYPACFAETAAGFETHYNPDVVHLDNVASQCRQAKVKKSLHRPKHRPSLPPKGIFLVLILVRFWDEPRALVWREELCQWINKMAPSGNFVSKDVITTPRRQ